MSLLRGFCAGDQGNNTNTQWTVEYEEVARAVSQVMWSLGITSGVRSKKINRVIVWEIYAHSNIMETLHTISRNFDIEQVFLASIDSIKATEEQRVVGLTVEDGYVIVDNYVLGHNSSHLVHEMSKYRGVGDKVLCINSLHDTRHPDNVIKTHDGIMVDCCKVERLYDAVIPYDTQVIGVDEAQFFDDLVEFVRDYLSRGYTLVVAGLDGDYLQRPFGRVLELVPIADTYTKKYALCNMCKSRGIFTRRITQDTQQILVGARDSYIATCRECLDAPLGPGSIV